jgi:hypothetical protein
VVRLSLPGINMTLTMTLGSLGPNFRPDGAERRCSATLPHNLHLCQRAIALPKR